MFTRSKTASTHNAQYNGSTTPSRSDSIKDPAPETACGTQQQRSRSSVSASAHGQVQHDQMRPTAASLPRGLGMPSPALPRASTRSSAFMSGPNGFGVLGSGNRPAQSTQSRRAKSPLTSPLFTSPLTLGTDMGLPMSLHVRAVSGQPPATPTATGNQQRSAESGKKSNSLAARVQRLADMQEVTKQLY